MRKLIGISMAVSGWYLASLIEPLDFFISNPVDTFEYVARNFITLSRAFFTTLFEAFFGLIIAVGFSYLFGIAATVYPPVLRPTKSLFVITQVLPVITLAPLFIASLGMGVASKVAMVSVMCFFPVFISLIKGISQVQASSDQFLSMYQAPFGYRLLKIYLPLSLPHAFVGLKVAATMAVLGAIVAEFLGAYYGLGKNLYRAPKLANAELMMSSAILTALMGITIFKTLEFFEKRMIKWEK